MKRVYTDVDSEYRALRHATGLVTYDGVGLHEVSGPGAPAFLGTVASRAIDFLLEGQISAALLLRDDGTIVSEAGIHCRGADYLVEVWPAQAAAAASHLAEAVDGDVTVTDVSANFRVFGLEGPESFKIAQKFVDFPIASMAYRSFTTTDGGLLVSRTGVTGEYGFKLHVPAADADRLRAELIDLGAVEVGFDAVDICRMETRFANLEAEGENGNPYDLGLQWMVDFGREFTGAAALADGPGERLPVCWRAADGVTEVPAAGTPLAVTDAEVGEVTHAVWSPTLGRVIGTGRVDRAVAASGVELTAGEALAETISAPFLVATSFNVSME